MIDLVRISLIFRVLLYSRERSSIIRDKNMQKLWKKNTAWVHFSAEGGDFNTNYTSKVEIVIPEIYWMKIVKWNFHLDGL